MTGQSGAKNIDYQRTQPVHVASGVCWNLDQLKAEIERIDEHGELIKLEVVHGFTPGKRCFHWTILAYPRLDQDSDICDFCGSERWDHKKKRHDFRLKAGA